MNIEDVRSVDELIEISTVIEPKYTFFRSGPFSNWYRSSFKIDDITYPTVEHWMMCEKARLFKDNVMERKILATDSPYDAKLYGRFVKNYDDNKWSMVRFGVVLRGCYEKFKQNAELRELLIRTNDSVMVEASPKDVIWGIGLAKTHPHANMPALWPGMNLLGFVLMEVRRRLK